MSSRFKNQPRRRRNRHSTDASAGAPVSPQQAAQSAEGVSAADVTEVPRLPAKPEQPRPVPPRPHKDRPADIGEHLAVAGAEIRQVQHRGSDGTMSPIITHGTSPRIYPMTVPRLDPAGEHPVQLVDRFVPRSAVRVCRWVKNIAVDFWTILTT